ncbi:MAG: hypothetical protein AAGF13_09405 [Pseudomonadota bacterium]
MFGAAAFFAILAAQAHAEQHALTGTAEGEGIILSADGTWRYDDAGGECCIEFPSAATYCGLPSEWSVFPEILGGRPTVISADGIRGAVHSLSPLLGPITVENLNRFLSTRVRAVQETSPMQHRPENVEINGRMWNRIAATGTAGQFFSIYDENGRVFVVETYEPGTTILSTRHKTLHQALIEGLELEVPS